MSHSRRTSEPMGVPPQARPASRRRERAFWRRAAVAGAMGALMLHVASLLAQQSQAVAAVLLLAFAATIVWRPELSMVLALTGFDVLVSLMPDDRLRYQVAVVLALFAVTGVAVMLRQLAKGNRWRRTPTCLDGPVLAITAYGMFSTLLGLARGHDPGLVIFTAYHVLQWPIFYLVVTYTLNRPERLGLGWLLEAPLNVISILRSVVSPARSVGGQGWLPIALAVSFLHKPLVGSGWLGLAVLLSTYAAVRAGFRTTWVNVGVSVMWMIGVAALKRHGRPLAMATVASALGLALLGLFVSVPGLSESNIGKVIAANFERGPGYRLTEARYGWQAFAASPIFGQGFGFRQEGAWIPELGRYGGGPVYHMFHLIILANQGLVGLVLVLWLFWRGLFGREAVWLRDHCADHPWAAVALGLQARTAGAFVSALFAGPRISHFEWVTQPALSLLCAQWARADLKRAQGESECPAPT
jgi:hypothetical protein